MDKQTGILLTIITLAVVFLFWMGRNDKPGISLFNINL
jgi:hypothetical protein